MANKNRSLMRGGKIFSHHELMKDLKENFGGKLPVYDQGASGDSVSYGTRGAMELCRLVELEKVKKAEPPKQFIEFKSGSRIEFLPRTDNSIIRGHNPHVFEGELDQLSWSASRTTDAFDQLSHAMSLLPPPTPEELAAMQRAEDKRQHHARHKEAKRLKKLKARSRKRNRK